MQLKQKKNYRIAFLYFNCYQKTLFKLKKIIFACSLVITDRFSVILSLKTRKKYS